MRFTAFIVTLLLALPYSVQAARQSDRSGTGLQGHDHVHQGQLRGAPPSAMRREPAPEPVPVPVAPPRPSRSEQEQMLVNAGLDRSDARLWLDADFWAEEVLAWRPFVNSYRHAGRSNLEEASQWRSWGWTPEQARYFVHDLCGTYRQAASQGGILSPEQLIAQLGNQC